jgi:hypothetical protein
MAQADIKLSEWPSQNPDINPRRLQPVIEREEKRIKKDNVLL